jgi:hypothetical protein
MSTEKLMFGPLSDLMALLCDRVPADYITSDLAVWSGDLYMRWLRHIRHRGTFSSMAVAFERFLAVAAVPRALRLNWLEVSFWWPTCGFTLTLTEYSNN